MRNVHPHIAALGLALLLGACANDDPAPGTDPAAESSDDRIEIDQPEPRLVVATESGVDVVDTIEGSVVGSFDTTVRPALSVAGDGRHVFLAQTDADVTHVLDAGSWASSHGDHSHYFKADPALRDIEISGNAPVHVVAHGSRTAIFHDDDGTATVFDEDGLLIDSLDESVVDSGSPHHGVVVPLDDGAFVSIPPEANSDDTLPTGVVKVDGSGNEVARFDDCPELHGETAAHDMIAFACADGVLLIDGDQETKVDYPTDAGRIGSFTPGPVGEFLVGDYTDTSLLAVETSGEHVVEIELGEPYAARAHDEHGDAVVLTTDGALRVVDPSTGETEGTIDSVVPPFEIPEDWQEPRPTLTVAGHTAFIADPAESVVVPVDLETSSVGEPVAVTGVPSAMVAVGTGPNHDH